MGELNTNTISTLDEWLSEQLAARQLSEELNAPLTLVSSILIFAASAFGIAGSFWLVFHYYSRNLLRNTTGLFICVIAYLDIIVALHSIVKALFNFPGIYAWLEYLGLGLGVVKVLEVIMTWSLITYAIIGLVLSFNTLFVVRYSGASSFLDSKRFLAIFISFVTPIVCFYLPLYLVGKGSHFFDINPACVYKPLNPCTDLKIIAQVLLISILAMLILLTLVSYLLVLWTLRRKEHQKSSTSDSFMIPLLRKLGIVFSLCILILWLPYLVRSIAITLFSKDNYYYDEAHFLRFDVFTFLIFCQNVLMPMRGYFHALSVLYIFKVPRQSDENIIFHDFKFLLFLTPIASKQELIRRYTTANNPSVTRKEDLKIETAKSIEQPHWTIQDKSLYNIPETPVDKKVFRFSQISIESNASGQIQTAILRALDPIPEEKTESE